MIGTLRAERVVSLACLGALVHAVGWLGAVLILGPSNLIFGLPPVLRSVLLMARLIPLCVLAAVYSAWMRLTVLQIVLVFALAGYIPFFRYWNLFL